MLIEYVCLIQMIDSYYSNFGSYAPLFNNLKKARTTYLEAYLLKDAIIHLTQQHKGLSIIIFSALPTTSQ